MGRKTLNIRPASYLLTGFLWCLFFVLYPGIPAADQNPQKARILDSHGKLPLYFIENKGQVDSKVRFYVKTPGQTLYFTDEGIVFDLFRRKAETSNDIDPNGKDKGRGGANKAERLVFSLLFDKSNKGVSIAGLEKQEAKVNYLLGGDKAAWKTNIPIFKGIFYKEVYNGIDFKVEGKGQAIKYEFIVNPEGNTGDIRLTYNGIVALSTNSEGELLIETAFGELKETRPYIYQEIVREREVGGGFAIQKPIGGGQERKFSYGFQIASYDPSYPLIIDPTLFFSTYLGGSGDDYGYGIATDTSGNAYVTGSTASTNFPTQNPYQGSLGGGGNVDAFITKLSFSGSTLSLAYSTYLGGTAYDEGNGIAIDTSGNAYITGYTLSNDFPTQNPYQDTRSNSYDAFITKLSADGNSLSYSTYLGGTGSDQGYGIAIDTAGNAYVTGSTGSNDFPTQNPYQAYGTSTDAFVTKLSFSDPTLSLSYSTYLGGTGSDQGYGIAIDTAGNAYVTGSTASDDFPTQNSYQAYGTSVMSSVN